MRIAELFHSIQGEGRFTGTPSVFVRTSGCNLRCWFCDTPYTSWNPEGTHRSLSEILTAVREFDCAHVVVTGGEPLLPAEIVPLTCALRAAGKFITIETAGTVLRDVAADLMSISPKLSNSAPREADQGRWLRRHEQTRHRPEVIRELVRRYDCQFKFVIQSPGDLDEVRSYLATVPEIGAEQVWLMPQAVSREELEERTAWLQPAATARGWRFARRLHLELFGNTRGT